MRSMCPIKSPVSPFVSAALAMFDVLSVKSIKGGNIVADGTEQELLKFEGSGRIAGYLDLSNMGAGDKVVIRQYMKIVKDGDYKKYAEESVENVQVEPVMYITPKETDISIRVTLQQTAGIFKVFPHNFIGESTW